MSPTIVSKSWPIIVTGATMDLEISGRTALVCASSRGLGKACATALAQAGCAVVINGRESGALQQAVHDIARAVPGAKITPIAADVGTEAGREALLTACPSPDILVNNNGGPPPTEFRKLSKEALIAGLDANMITPIALIQRVIDGMVARRFGRIINITSLSVKMPLSGLDLSSGARAGLTAFLAGPAREVAHANVTINQILPGMFDTDRLRNSTARMAQMKGMSATEMGEQRRQQVPARRFGNAEEFGRLCAFLASAQAGYITGQNLVIDGGLFPSAF
jgi:3-oxoacyl-[acyl-carrier protein] reductase